MVEIIDKKVSSNDDARYKKYVYLGPIYLVMAGILYLWGYWSTFSVNILEYAGVADIAKTAAIPILSTFNFFILGAVLGEFLVDRANLPVGGGQQSRMGKFLLRAIPIIIPIYGALVLVLLMVDWVWKWNVLPILITLPAYGVFKQVGFLEDVLPNDSARSIVVFIIAALPFFAYGYGKQKGGDITEGNKYIYVLSQVQGFPLSLSADVRFRPRFLGQVSDYLFFYNPTNRSTVISNFKEVKTLELKSYDQKNPTVMPVPVPAPAVPSTSTSTQAKSSP